MPDIFHVITDKGVGGAGVFLTGLLDAADTRTGSLVLLPTGSLLCSRLSARGIPYVCFPQKEERSLSLKALRFLRAFLQQRKPTLLVSHAALSARIAARSLGIPTLSVRHCDTAVSALSLPLYNALTDATVATSPALAIRLRNAGVRNVFMIENGYTRINAPTDADTGKARALLGLPNDKIILGIVGRLSPIKGQEIALRALARLGKAKERFLLCFLGCGESEKRLRAISAEFYLEEQVRFMGYMADTCPFYHAIDVHLSCSLGSETSSLSLAEGMSAARPTVASDTPGNRARVGDGGLFFPVGDSAALAALLLRLEDPKERYRLSCMAKSRAETLPTWERTRKDYRALFDAFCGELVTNGCIFRKDMLS